MAKYYHPVRYSNFLSEILIKYDFPDPGANCNTIDGSVSPDPRSEEVFSGFVSDNSDLVVFNFSLLAGQSPSPAAEMELDGPVDIPDSETETASNISEERVLLEFDSGSDEDEDLLPVVDCTTERLATGHSESQSEDSEPLKQKTTDLNNLPQTHSNFSFDDDSEEVLLSTSCLDKLRNNLRKHTKYKPEPPLFPFNTNTLSKTEELSLQHYIA